MSLKQKIMSTVAQWVPDREVDPLIGQPGPVGQALNRADAGIKVRGEAKFSAEYSVANLAYAALVYSTVCKGKILTIDAEKVVQLPGVVAVITHLNAPKLKTPPVADSGGGSSGAAAADLPVFQDDKIHWNGQPVAVVVAESQEQADEAAFQLHVVYEEHPAEVDFEALIPQARPLKDVQGEPPEDKFGDAEGELAAAAHKVDNIYRTPRHNHNAIEPHATIAYWEGEGKEQTLTVFDPSQNLHAFKNTLAAVFSLEKTSVRFLSPFVGGAFGGKGSIWFNTILCALAAKIANRPVKLVLSREGVFRIVGGRTLTEQRVALAAEADGRFTAVLHTGTLSNSHYNVFPEQFTFPARRLYATKSLYVNQKKVLLDTVATTFMRAPGESIGTFALESAVDELATELGIDPVELRRLNEPEKDIIKGTEFSHRDLLLAYSKGAEAFGWKHQPPRSQPEGEWLVGQGVATAYYPYYRMASTARVRINADGTALVSAAAHEMGMGTATVQIQHAAQRLGLPMRSVTFAYGDSDLPESPVAGGSNQTASIVASVTAAVEKAHKELLDLAYENESSPLYDCKFGDLEARDGGLYVKNSTRGATYASILAGAGQEYVEAEQPAPSPLEIMKYSMHSYGAQFVEVRVKEATGEVRVTRIVGSFDVGRVLNPKTAISQLRGGIIMGLGAALTEETLFDKRYGRIVNASLGEYHVPVNLDVPHIEVLFNDIPDPHSPLGVHGVGEIGITGVAGAVANAIFNATGKRIRELPITLDKLF